MEHEHRIDAPPIAVIVLMVKSNTIESLRPLLQSLRSTLARLHPRQFAGSNSDAVRSIAITAS
jgi:hypothetical protein